MDIEIEEIPKVDFIVRDIDGNVLYRDAIVYNSMAELRNDNALERQAKFETRYQIWLQTLNQPQILNEDQVIEESPEEAI